jgi:hypothetical protein
MIELLARTISLLASRDGNLHVERAARSSEERRRRRSYRKGVQMDSSAFETN